MYLPEDYKHRTTMGKHQTNTHRTSQNVLRHKKADTRNSWMTREVFQLPQKSRENTKTFKKTSTQQHIKSREITKTFRKTSTQQHITDNTNYERARKRIY